MTTKLIFLDDSFLFNCHAEIVSMGKDERGQFVVLDQTIAYPQGGGQPSDKGRLVQQENQIPFEFVGFRDGEVRHYIPESSSGMLSLSEAVKIEIDPTHRLNNARSHTAGHLVTHVIESMEPSLLPIKGHHFLNGSYVEFVNSNSIGVNDLLDNANPEIQSVISKEMTIRSYLSDFREIQSIRPRLATLIPQGKPTRLVSIGDFLPLPCGGTHLADLHQLGVARVTKAKRSGGNIRVSYTIGPGM